MAITNVGTAQAAAPPASVLHFRSDTIVAEDGAAVQTVHIETRVNNDAAARKQAQQDFPYSEGLEQVDLVEAYTQKPDGTRVPIKPGAVRTQLAPGVPNVPAYSDRKQVVAVLPDVAGGDTLAVTWRRTIKQPIFPGHYAQTNFFVRTLPWDDVAISVSTPADKPMRTEAHGAPVEQAEEDGRHLYRWHFSAPAVATDPAALSPLDRAPRFFASTFPDWAALSSSYAGLFAPKAEVTPRIQALADQVTAGTDDRREQARLLYEWVGQHVRWVAIYLGTGSFVPHTADEVLANGYGDCKDQVALYMTLLRAKGIAAEPVLINLSPTYTLSGPATTTAFNHVITYLPEWQLYADTTPGRAPFGTLPLNEYGKPTLHISAQGEAPGRMATLPPGFATERLRTEAKLDEEGVVSGTSTTEATGPFAVALQFVGQAIQAQGPEQFAEAQLRRLNHPGKGSFSFPAADATPAPVERITGEFTQEAQPGMLDGNTFAPTTGLRLLLRTGEGPLGPVFDRNLPVSEDTPCYAARQEEELSLALPDGYQPIRLPNDTAFDGSFYHYESRWSFTDGVVKVQRLLASTYDQPFCTGESRAEAARALAKIRIELSTQIGLKRAD